MLKVLTVAAAVALAIQGYSIESNGQALPGEDPQGNENQSGLTFREYL